MIVSRKLGTFFIVSWLLFFAVSCGENARYQDDSEQRLRQRILFTPKDQYGIPTTELSATRFDTVLTGTTARLWGDLWLGDSAIRFEEVEFYLQNSFWVANGDTLKAYLQERTFSEPGLYEATLFAIDYLGDTLRDTISIFVNAPADVELLEPIQDAATIDPLESSLLFRWKTIGVEAWEKPHCAFFVATNPDSVWTGEGIPTPCNSSLTLAGPWSAPSYYWGVLLWTDSTEWDSQVSAVHQFRTLIPEIHHAQLRIPLGLLLDGPASTAHLRLLDAQGNLLRDSLTAMGETEVFFDSLPVTNLATLIVDAPLFPEYAPETLQVPLQAKVHFITDTLFLRDATPPRIWPAQQTFPGSDSLVFYAADLGSGLPLIKFVPMMGEEAIPFKSNVNHISFRSPCLQTVCKIHFEAKDNAGNEYPNHYWTVMTSSSGTIVSGPFPSQYNGDD